MDIDELRKRYKKDGKGKAASVASSPAPARTEKRPRPASVPAPPVADPSPKPGFETCRHCKGRGTVPAGGGKEAVCARCGGVGRVKAEPDGRPDHPTGEKKRLGVRATMEKAKEGKKRPRYGKPRFDIIPAAGSGDGRPDAILGFGKHKGQRVSDLAREMAGRGYLRWVTREDFPDTLKQVIEDRLSDPPAF